MPMGGPRFRTGGPLFFVLMKSQLPLLYVLGAVIILLHNIFNPEGPEHWLCREWLLKAEEKDLRSDKSMCKSVCKFCSYV